MNISQEKIDNLNAVLKINIDPADYTPRVDKAIKDQAKKAKIPGFARVWCRHRTLSACMVKVYWLMR